MDPWQPKPLDLHRQLVSTSAARIKVLMGEPVQVKGEMFHQWRSESHLIILFLPFSLGAYIISTCTNSPNATPEHSMSKPLTSNSPSTVTLIQHAGTETSPASTLTRPTAGSNAGQSSAHGANSAKGSATSSSTFKGRASLNKAEKVVFVLLIEAFLLTLYI